jgi:N-acetylneuraminic acid mutarotase
MGKFLKLRKFEYFTVGLGVIAITIGLVAIYLNIYILDSQTPIGRLSFGAVYDPQLQRTVIFGGGSQDVSGYEVYDDMWIYDSARNLWTEIFPTIKPTARSGHLMVYDSFNQKTILFGGWNEGVGLMNDTWVYDSQSNQWVNVSPSISPALRQSQAMCYDPIFHKVILFGGYRSVGPHFNDTWAFDYLSNSWTELHPTTSPSGRYGARMVYDPINQRIFLFGGRTTTPQNDVWVYYYGNNTWVELSTTNNPGTRYWHGMVYDSHYHKVIVFGGRHTGAPGDALEDTWIFNPSTNAWSEVFPSSHPSNRMEPAMVYDPSTQKEVLFGGFRFVDITLGDTWIYTYSSNSWTFMKRSSI